MPYDCFALERKAMSKEEIPPNSPYTGTPMILQTKSETIPYKGEAFTVDYESWLCPDTGETFTTDEVDERNIERVKQAHATK